MICGHVGDEWAECFTVHGLTLPLAPYVGFSALTGDISDNHEYVFIPSSSSTSFSPGLGPASYAQHHLRHNLLRHPLLARRAARQAHRRQEACPRTRRRRGRLGLDLRQALPLRRRRRWSALRLQDVPAPAGARWWLGRRVVWRGYSAASGRALREPGRLTTGRSSPRFSRRVVPA